MNEYKTFSEKCKRLDRTPSEECGRLIQFLSIKEKRAETAFNKEMYAQVMEDIGLMHAEIDSLLRDMAALLELFDRNFS